MRDYFFKKGFPEVWKIEVVVFGVEMNIGEVNNYSLFVKMFVNFSNELLSFLFCSPVAQEVARSRGGAGGLFPRSGGGNGCLKAFDMG